MEVQDDARAGLARRGESAPAERRVDVVGVHDARAGAAHRLPHLLGPEAAAQEPGRRAARRQRRGVALEHLDVLAEVLADQPREVLDGAFLPAGDAVAVVQEQDHGARQSGGSWSNLPDSPVRPAHAAVAFSVSEKKVHRNGGVGGPQVPTSLAGRRDHQRRAALGGRGYRARGDGDRGPRIVGEPTPGFELTASPGQWTPSSATATYDWLRCDGAGVNCVPVAGSCERRYTVRDADLTHTLRVRLTVTEPGQPRTSPCQSQLRRPDHALLDPDSRRRRRDLRRGHADRARSRAPSRPAARPALAPPPPRTRRSPSSTRSPSCASPGASRARARGSRASP